MSIIASLEGVIAHTREDTASIFHTTLQVPVARVMEYQQAAAWTGVILSVESTDGWLSKLSLGGTPYQCERFLATLPPLSFDTKLSVSSDGAPPLILRIGKTKARP